MKKIALLYIIALLPAISSLAQDSDTLQRAVTIVKEFTPIVRDAEKINTMPSVATPSFNRDSVQYNYNATSTAVPTIATDVNIPYIPTPANNDHKYRGYFDAGIGNYLALTGNAGYHILDTPHDKLNIGAQFTSLNWDVPINSHASAIGESLTRQTFYDARAGLHYAHTFDNNISVSLRGAYRFLDFNYYGVAGVAPVGSDVHPFNRVNNLYAELQIDNKEAQHYDYEHWYATAGYSLYRNKRGAYVPTPSSEHHAYLKGGYSYMLDQYWSVGGVLNIDFLQYNGVIHLDNSPETPGYVLNTNNVFMARLLPHVEYRKDRFNFHAGVKVDISANDKTVFRFAPDVRMDWEFHENYFLQANIEGGKKLHTWHDMSQQCIYFDPSYRIPSTYSPLDAKVGFRFRFILELSLSAYAGYEVAAGALFQSVEASSQAIAWQSIDASCFKLGARVEAYVLQYVTLSADIAYREWKQKNGSLISYDKPRWEGNARVTIHPHKLFDIELGYNMQLGRDYGIYGKLNDIHNVQAMVTYHPNQRLSIFVQGNNLLNCKYDYYYGLPAPRIQGMVGAELKF